MTASLSFPGVHIIEVSSGVRTITGVASSNTAFIGRALRGPVNEPVIINSFGDFERTFGGLWRESTLGYAVRDYFQNGGARAIIVRLFNRGAGGTAGDETATLTIGSGGDRLVLEAVNPGLWGNGLRATVEHVSDATSAQLGQPAGTLWNLRVDDTTRDTFEVFRNVSHVAGHPRHVKDVLANESELVNVTQVGTTRPPATSDAVTLAERALAAATDATRAAAQATLTQARTTQGGLDGVALTANASFLHTNAEANKEGLFALLKTDLFNLLNIPPHSFSTSTVSGDIELALITAAVNLCAERRAMLILDPPASWDSFAEARTGVASLGTASKNACVFFPRLRAPDPLRQGQLVDFAPGGAVAGVFARTDATRGVWKAPAGLEATLAGVPALSVPLTDPEIGQLNELGVNCLRTAPAAGRVVWGARTREGDDRLASEWKYIPIRRLALFIEESLFRGTQWVVFEPNDEPLWGQIRLNLGAFMQGLFRQGAFQGRTPREAYFVKVDRETTTQADINRGIVNIHVGFAPLRPAEFVVLRIQQIAGALAAG